jgi:hypothetical protein
MVKTAHKFLNHKLPSTLNGFFDVFLDRDHDLRNNYDLILPKPKKETFRRSFLFQIPFCWNSLPEKVKRGTFGSLKTHVKTTFVEVD